MRNVQIITDSCADLNQAQINRYHMDYARMTTVENGKESPALLTWSPEEAHNFYDRIRAGVRITTTQVPVGEFERIFRMYLEEKKDILYIACSSKQSGSVNTGHVTAERLMKEYPGSTVICLDSLNATIGEGMLAIRAAEMAEEGKNIQEIAGFIMGIRNHVREFATVHTLEYLKRSGRVSASSAFFGNLMGVKPILVADAGGAQAAFKKVRGRHTSLTEIVSLLGETIIEPEHQTVCIAHADCDPQEIQELSDMVRDHIACAGVSVGLIGPIVGASVGPDTIGVWAFGEEITYRAD